MKLPYEITIKEPNVEIVIRTKSEKTLTQLHGIAREYLSREELDDLPFFRFNIPRFLQKDRRLIRWMTRYDEKYASSKMLDFTLALTKNVELSGEGSNVEFTLTRDAIQRGRTRLDASLPEKTEEVLIVSRGNVAEEQLEPLVEHVRTRVRSVHSEHRQSDLDDVVRIVVFCYGGPGTEFEMII